jgi:acyl carrier protein
MKVMRLEDVREQIRNTLTRLLTDRGQSVPEIRGDSSFLSGELGIDSVDLAAVVVQLQSSTGRDPFEKGFVEFRTVDELALLFAGAA